MQKAIAQRGVVLIVVLWVVALLTILLAAFVLTLKVERQTVADVSRGIQARAAADGVLNYLAALTAVAAPELAEMPGQRYELVLNDLPVSFRLLPETVFIPVNALGAEQLEAVFSGMGLADAAVHAQSLVEWRQEGQDETTGEPRAAIEISSLMQLVHLLGLEIEQVRPYEPWLSFVGRHGQVLPGYVPVDVLDSLGLLVEGHAELESAGLPWEPGAPYRVQLEVGGAHKPRKIEMIASFSGGSYRLLLVNEYNAVFSLNDLSE